MLMSQSASILIRGRSALHETVRDNVQVRIVHGSWRDEDSNRQLIEVGFHADLYCHV